MRKVGDGADTVFWYDCWVGGVPFSVRLCRMFYLAVDKSTTVRSLFLLGWGEGGEAWVWRRRLWVLEEEMLVSFQSTFPDG